MWKMRFPFHRLNKQCQRRRFLLLFYFLLSRFHLLAFDLFAGTDQFDGKKHFRFLLTFAVEIANVSAPNARQSFIWFCSVCQRWSNLAAEVWWLKVRWYQCRKSMCVNVWLKWTNKRSAPSELPVGIYGLNKSQKSAQKPILTIKI